jgi:hypothetical protein
VLAGIFVLIFGTLLIAGMFVFISGKLLVPGILVVPLIVPLASLMGELVDCVSVELLGLF